MMGGFFKAIAKGLGKAVGWFIANPETAEALIDAVKTARSRKGGTDAR